jgi:hypothetical protein
MYVHQVHSLAMDGADQSAHDVPKVLGRVPKDLTPWPQKLQCVLAHGVLLCMFNVLNVVHAGANAAMTCLMRAMQLLEGGFSGILYLQVDGGSENWNKVLFALVDLWFDLYPNLQTVIVSRLPVGHTHVHRYRQVLLVLEQSVVWQLLWRETGGCQCPNSRGL